MMMFRLASRKALGSVIVAAVVGLIAVGVAAAPPPAGASDRRGGGARTDRVSVSSAGDQANGQSFGFAVSAHGRFVVFDSHASNLVPGDTNRAYDVFVRDRLSGRTRRASVGPGGAQADVNSWAGGISADGRFVVFDSRASNLVAGDANGSADVFVRDLKARATRRVSVASDGGEAENDSYGRAVSADGRFVVFESAASNLVPGDTNDAWDVFVRDRVAHTTERVSVGTGGAQARGYSFGGAISANGRYVAFTSFARNLVAHDGDRPADVFVRDRRTDTTGLVSVGSHGRQAIRGCWLSAISATGRYVVFETEAKLVAADTNRTQDVYVRDRRTHRTSRASVGQGGAQARRGASSSVSGISADGRYVVFSSHAHNLVRYDTNRARDVFVRDRLARTTRLVSIGPGGVQADRRSVAAAISADGRTVVFASWATNLVRHDTNLRPDVFARDWVR